MTANEPVITFETLYDIMRREKARDELQKLGNTFYQDVFNYIRDKQQILDSQAGKDSIFASQELDKTKTQLKNILKIVRELYDRRESKIIQLAVLSARNNEKIYDTSALLVEEQELFNRIKVILINNRDSFLSFSSTRPNGEKPKDLKITAEKDNGCKVRMLCGVPEFLGVDLQPYGPYENQAIISLPKQIADMLASSGQAAIENESTQKNEEVL